MYRAGFRPERELGGLEADLTVTLAARAASDLAATPNASEAAILTETGLYAGPAALVYLKPFGEDGAYDPGSLGGEFRVGFLFMREHILAAPVTGFDATDIALTNAAVKLEGGAPAFIAKPPRGLHGAEPIAADSPEYAGSYLYEATIVPDAQACASGCEITVGVRSGAALGAVSTAESDLGQLVRPNVAAEPLTVQREAAGSRVRVSALAIRQIVDSNSYWVDVLISGSRADFYGHIQLRGTNQLGNVVEMGRIDRLPGSRGGLHSFWAYPRRDGDHRHANHKRRLGDIRDQAGRRSGRRRDRLPGRGEQRRHRRGHRRARADDEDLHRHRHPRRGLGQRDLLGESRIDAAFRRRHPERADAERGGHRRLRGGTVSHGQSSSFDIGDQSEVPASLTARTRK